MLRIEGLPAGLSEGGTLTAVRASDSANFELEHTLNARQSEVIFSGGLINHFRSRRKSGQQSAPSASTSA